MRTRRKKPKIESETPKKPVRRKRNGHGAEIDPTYQFFHLSWLETSSDGRNIEKEIIRHRIEAEKAITWSNCWSFRVKRGKYDKKLLNSIAMLFEYDGLDYLHGEWTKVPLPPQNRGRRRRRIG